MRIVTLAALAALTLSAQDVKVDPKSITPTPPPTERQLTETETLKLQLAAAKIALLNKQFDIAGYNKELIPIQAEQNAIAMAACKSVGIPEELIKQGQCGLNLGIDNDAKPMLGADGKPVAARVWWNKPAPPVVAEKK